MLDLNKIYNIDCQEGIKLLEGNLVNLVITYPPYNVNLGNNKYNKNKYDTYKDDKNHYEYLEWLKNIFISLYPKLTEDGRVVINIGSGKNGNMPTHSHIINFMKKIGYNVYTTIVWDKSQVGNRASWGSFNSPSCPKFFNSF
jgi:site-specific DNA-methyltransferase (adenine-specific)